ncbi:hypothetical protein CK203_066326 [Vitis vinifera]|uniref:Uncharacterized protein n=1 Tax=Vitis vinifera TaxID=29760 RepID=A0A438G2I9_VITVI|nr:hypothetical protein CK203_066326 [Vitis vinifera]
MGERERERERERESERGSERACEEGKRRDYAGEGDEDKEGSRRRRRGSRFAVESKVFELELLERRGKPQIFIEESKGGVSSWIRMGVESLGFLMEGLNHCIRDEKEDRWVKEWKEQGRSFSLLRSVEEKKRDGLQWRKIYRFCVGQSIEDHMQEEKVGGNMDLKRTFTEVVKRPICRVINPVQVKVWREEIQRNLEKLEHRVVGSWNPRSRDEEDLEKLGRFLASSWGLKGSLGWQNWREAESCWNLNIWKKLNGEEEEESNEIWVRIFGLPVSLWNPTVLRRVGDECGGFIDIDSKTKKLEELQWARILVRSDGGDKPSTLEIGIEEEVFTLALWWELRPSVKKLRVDSRRWGEVRDDNISRSGSRVEVE